MSISLGNEIVVNNLVAKTINCILVSSLGGGGGGIGTATTSSPGAVTIATSITNDSSTVPTTQAVYNSVSPLQTSINNLSSTINTGIASASGHGTTASGNVGVGTTAGVTTINGSSINIYSANVGVGTTSSTTNFTGTVNFTNATVNGLSSTYTPTQATTSASGVVGSRARRASRVPWQVSRPPVVGAYYYRQCCSAWQQAASRHCAGPPWACASSATPLRWCAPLRPPHSAIAASSRSTSTAYRAAPSTQRRLCARLRAHR